MSRILWWADIETKLMVGKEFCTMRINRSNLTSDVDLDYSYSDYDNTSTPTASDLFASTTQVSDAYFQESEAVQDLSNSEELAVPVDDESQHQIHSILINLGKQMEEEVEIRVRKFDASEAFLEELLETVPWIVLACVVGVLIGVSMWLLSTAFVRISMWAQKKKELEEREIEMSVTDLTIAKLTPTKNSDSLANSVFTPMPNFKNRKSQRGKSFYRQRPASPAIVAELKNP